MINFKLSLLRKIVRSYFFDTVKITSLIYHNIRTLYEHEIHKKKGRTNLSQKHKRLCIYIHLTFFLRQTTWIILF